MARHQKPPRLYLDPTRNQWMIRDAGRSIRTGLAKAQTRESETALANYIAAKHKPQASPSPTIADCLLHYYDSHLIHTLAPDRNNKTILRSLARWWGDRRVSDITPDGCRAYIAHKGEHVVAARRELQTLKAAIRYWHASSKGPLDRVPHIVMPPAPAPRERWLTRHELARLLWAARRSPHLRRFVLVAYYTGTRSGAIREMQWSWIDFNASVMRRRAIGEVEHAKKRRPMVRLGKRILSHLKRWKRLDGSHGKYVVHYNGAPIKRQFTHSWRRATKQAGLNRDVNPHSLRHTRATHLVQKGLPLWDIAGALGMTMATLERTYGHHHPDWQRDVADA